MPTICPVHADSHPAIRRISLFIGLCFVASACETAPAVAHAAEYVIHISVDGLNAKTLQTMIDAGDAPTFRRLRDEGVSTFNARTDFTHTNTIPNHTTMLTGRPVFRPESMAGNVHHNWTFNDVPNRGTTIHENHPDGGYVASTFDAAHDAGLSTALFASKDKFLIYEQTYGENGGSDTPHGRNKFDAFVIHDDGEPSHSATINQRFLADMAVKPYRYTFIHYRDTDSAGHKFGWGGSAYRQAIKIVDGYLGDVLKLVEASPALVGKTAIIVTSDHGGLWYDHNDIVLPPNYTIPLFAWGAGVGRGDLYKINADSRTDPGEGRPNYNATGQPIRNGDSGNLALALLGLGPIPDSLINAKQDLRVSLAGDYNNDGSVDAADSVVWRSTQNSQTDLRADGNHDGRVDQADYDVWNAHFGKTAL